MTKNSTSWKQWAKDNPHLVIVPLLAILGIAAMTYQWWITPELIFRAHTAREWTPEEALEKAGTYGDMFGVTNALFSGVAMVAAISAIILQVFEFGAQRQELVQANVTHIERLEFDREVHEYDRRIHFAKLVNAFQEPEILAGVKVLHEWEFRNDHVHAATVSHYHHDKTAWESKRLTFLRDRKNEDSFRALEMRVLEAPLLDPLMHYLNEISLFRPSIEELKTWKPVLSRFHWVIKEYACAADGIITAAPNIWPKAVEEICSRFFELQCEEKI